MKSHSVSALAAVVLGSGWAVGQDLVPSQPYGVVVNGSVEELSNGQPVHWTVQTRRRRGRRGAQQGFGATVDSTVAHEGSRSLALDAAGGNPGFWQDRTFVRPFATYRFTGWIKTENVQGGGANQGAAFTFQGMQLESQPRPVTGTSDWTQFEATFRTGDRDSFYLRAVLGGGPTRGRGRRGAGVQQTELSGKAWFDDMKLELLAGGTYQPALAIDAANTGPIMNDYVYGQFIEHLGRCIYGGIWAEMLEDRKFYYDIEATVRQRGERPGGREGVASPAASPSASPGQVLFRAIRESPWMIVGDEGSVEMLTKEEYPEQVYVGDRTPRVDLGGGTPGGVVQPELAVIRGKAYEGRVVLAGDASAAPIDVSLIWGNGPDDRQTVRIPGITGEYTKYPIEFTAGESSENAELEIVGRGRGKFAIGTASLMPADNIKGMRPDTLALLKELNAPIYRWPGGNFVSGYDWSEGIGDRDTRPPRKNPAWTGVEHNDFGLHEFFDLLAEINAEPFIALNAGLGTSQSAVQEVEYVNGGADTPMGRLRVANGGPVDPWKCTYWAVGNEMSGNWQLGNVPIEQFVQRHNEFASGLLEVDPTIKLVASGEAVNANPNDWDRTLLSVGADYTHLNSKHFYRQDYSSPGGLMSHARQIADSIGAIARSHRQYLETIPELRGKNVTVSLDEWNYWYGPHVFGELGTRYFLRDAIGMAGGINEFIRNTDVIEIACVAQTVNVIGMIKTTKTAAVLDSSGVALAMYRKHFGYIPVAVTGAPEPLDAAAAWTKDKSALTISVVNMTWDPHPLTLDIRGADLSSNGKAYVLTGDDDMAYNQPGEEMRVRYTEQDVNAADNKVEVPPVSATVFVFPVR